MRKRIYIKSWLKLKPYGSQTMTDLYYLNLSNDIKKAITTNEQSYILQKYLDKEEMNLLACFLTSYFEDIISETNIWNSFIKVHLRLYQKHLPFYTLDDYYEEEINFEDVSLLIWYFLNTIQAEKFIAPFNDFIFSTAEKVMNILDEAWEYAPINEHLKSYYKIAEDEEDFYIARNLIDTILFKSYLFHTDLLFKLKEQEYDIVEKNKNEHTLMAFLNMNRDNVIHNTETQLLSLAGKEWAAEILGKHHPLSAEILNISQKINGYFFYKGQDENAVFVEHIASAKKFKITKKSMDHSDELEEIDTIIFIGIIKWRNEWWFSGTYYQTPFNADLVLDEKNSQASRSDVSFLDHQQEEVGELLKKQLQAFKDFNNDSQIVFLPSEKIDSFCAAYINFFNKSLNYDEQEIKAAKERMHKDGFFGDDDNVQNLTEISETGLVFFNPKSGIEIALAVNSAFPLEINPYFVKENSKEHTIRLLMDESYSTELTRYCFENCKDKLPFLKNEIGKMYLDDIDFLLRFWKSNNYHTQPSITYTG